MHEYSMAASIVEGVMGSIQGKGVTKVTEVEIELGELSFMTQDQMRELFEMAASGTPVEGARLTITQKDGTVRCLGCGFEGRPNIPDKIEDHHHVHIQCPKCEGLSVEMLDGKDVVLKNIKAEVG